MFQIDPNAVVAVIAVSALLSPIITAAINNKHQLKLKQIELYENDKKQALIKFINSATAVAYNPTDVEIELEYQSAFNSLFIYFPNIKVDIIYSFEEYRAKLAIKDNPEDYKSANSELTNLVQELSKQIMKK